MTSCDCIIECDIDCGPEVCSAKTRTARKEHECGECHRTIEVGESYEYTWGIWDGEQEVYKTCSGCKSVRSLFFYTYYFGMIWESLEEELRYCSEDLPWVAIGLLPKRARDGVLDIVEDIWDRYSDEAVD